MKEMPVRIAWPADYRHHFGIRSQRGVSEGNRESMAAIISARGWDIWQRPFKISFPFLAKAVRCLRNAARIAQPIGAIRA
jgi:hypothetical protein